MRKALIVYGGWDGHQPKQVAELFRRILSEADFSVELSDSLSAFADAPKLSSLHLIVPAWTMGDITPEQLNPILDAVANAGVGIAGAHGGMCDAFRNSPPWQFLTGGQWVAHPGDDGVKYTVRMGPTASPITEGIKDFEVTSEQYYMHVDPAVKVLAHTRFPVADGPHASNGSVDMPVIWTKTYGKGRVFYNSIGHQAKLLEDEPCLTLMRRGFLWAAKADTER